MRVLLLLRGSPGCGKSTWIEQNGLKPYTLCADDIRLQCSSPVLTVSGREEISQSNDKMVWEILFRMLELRMMNGEFTVIDATNSKTSEMNRYKDMCQNYRYRIYCVDFTDIPIDVAKDRNRMRSELKQVPEEVIEKMYSRFQTQKIPSGIKVIKPDELDKIWLHKINLTNYKKVNVIGDIHGCATALRKFINGSSLNQDEFYIFCGDYIDRGIENADVIKFLIEIYNLPNVCLLEGNHERWLWIWANDGVSGSKEFEFVTKTQLENAKIDKKDVRQLYRRLGQCAYFSYGDNVFLVTHAGMSAVPDNLTKVATSQMIKGVGNYNDFEKIAESFVINTPENFYQIHGHRNTKGLPVKVNDRCFNLEGRVEFGGCLRCVELLADGTVNVVEIKNDVYNKEIDSHHNQPKDNDQKSVGDIILELRQNKYVQEKKYGNISSFNFTKTAFYDKIWDDQTMRARGLYINIPKQKVVARAYDKFFNINERPETKFDMLQHRLAFPAVAYVKENGFLGIVSYNDESDSLFITTKSCPDGDYAIWFKEMLEASVTPDTLDRLKQYIKDNNVSFVFECVDMKNDPHIIEYDGSKLFLLDIIYNDMQYKKFSFEQLCDISNEFGFTHKEKAYVIESWREFFDWYYDVTSDDYKYNNRNVEGFVIEDSNGYMVKLKLQYYNFWKFMRSVAHEAIKKGYIDSRRTAALTTPIANQFYGWVKTLHDVDDKELIPKDICTLRSLFYKSDAGKQFENE